MNRNGQSRRRQNVSFQTIIVGRSPICRRQLAAEGAALFRPTLAGRIPYMLLSSFEDAPGHKVTGAAEFGFP
jgi:hypothetical protein